MQGEYLLGWSRWEH